jgi:hypothetical protein
MGLSVMALAGWRMPQGDALSLSFLLWDAVGRGSVWVMDQEFWFVCET